MILVTGAAGFIGSVLVRELNKQGREDLILVDRLRDTTKWLNLRKCKYELYCHADELFNADMESYLQECEAIFHIGACSATTEKDMDYLMQNNVEYSKVLFQIATSLGIPFIYASSAATYGDGEEGYDDQKSIDSLLPLNPYGYSKQLFDQWALKQELTPKAWFGFKFFNVYGANEYHKGDMRSIVHKSFGQIKDCGKVKLFKSHKEGFKDGEQLRDFVYVNDIVSAMMKFWQGSDTCKSGIYNLGTGNARSFKDLVLAVFKSLNKEANVEYIDMPESIRNQYQYFTEAKMDKLHSQLSDFKFHSLEEGIEDYIASYLNTDDPYY